MNNKGFVLVWLSILLVTILGVLSSTSSLLIIQWNKTKNVELCRNEIQQIQKYAANQGKFLLSLNPQSVRLRTELLIVEAKIAAAIAAGQIPLVKLLKAERILIRMQQKKLDSTQRMIIKKTQLQLKLKLASFLKRLNYELSIDKSNRSKWTPSQYILGPPPIPKFSFKPTDQLLAPTYEPYKNFEKSQSMAVSWAENYQWKTWQKAFSFPTQIKSQCRISLREGTWKTIIQRDRL